MQRPAEPPCAVARAPGWMGCKKLPCHASKFLPKGPAEEATRPPNVSTLALRGVLEDASGERLLFASVTVYAPTLPRQTPQSNFSQVLTWGQATFAESVSAASIYIDSPQTTTKINGAKKRAPASAGIAKGRPKPRRGQGGIIMLDCESRVHARCNSCSHAATLPRATEWEVKNANSTLHTSLHHRPRIPM